MKVNQSASQSRMLGLSTELITECELVSNVNPLIRFALTMG